MDALKRNPSLDVSYFPTGKIFDAKQLKNRFDIILLWENNTYGMPTEIRKNRNSFQSNGIISNLVNKFINKAIRIKKIPAL